MAKPDKAKNLKYSYLSPGPSNVCMGWWGSLMNFLKVKNLCPSAVWTMWKRDLFSLRSFTDFQVLNPGLPSALDGVLNWHRRVYCTIPASLTWVFFGFFCRRMYLSRLFILACKIFLCLARALELLHSSLHYVTKPDPTNTPKAEAGSTFSIDYLQTAARQENKAEFCWKWVWEWPGFATPSDS